MHSTGSDRHGAAGLGGVAIPIAILAADYACNVSPVFTLQCRAASFNNRPPPHREVAATWLDRGASLSLPDYPLHMQCLKSCTAQAGTSSATSTPTPRMRGWRGCSSGAGWMR